MNVSVKDAGACRKTMDIAVPAETVAAERAETLKAFAGQVHIPGFRKGKAPAPVVEKKFAKEISKELQERLVPKFYHKAIGETGLKVVNVVHLSDAVIEAGKPLGFEVTVDVEPEFKLPTYEGIPVKEDRESVAEGQVQAEIDHLRNQYANYEEAEGRIVQRGDMVQLTYGATKDGIPLKEAVPEAKGVGGGSGYWISADEHSFLPGMGEQVVGMGTGDRKQVVVRFPEGFIVKELGGIEASYDIEVTGVRVRKLPEIDETFLNRLQVASEEELRKRIRDQLDQQADTRARNSKYSQIVGYLLGRTVLDVPQSVLQGQVRSQIYEIARRRMMLGQSQEQIEQQGGDIRKEAEQRALDAAKLRYIGLAIAKEQGIEAGENEIDDEIAAMAVRQRKDARALRKELEAEETIGNVGDQVRIDKALDYLLKNAKVK